jgi:hypothetical protein
VSDRGSFPAVCARCGMAIKQMFQLTGSPEEAQLVWVHGGPADHEPDVAFPGSPPRLYCDFCSQPDPVWVIDTDRDFTVVTTWPDGTPVTENSEGGWAACHVCASLVRRRRMRAVRDRSRAKLGPLGADERAFHRERIARIHAAFLASGPHPPRRIEREG